MLLLCIASIDLYYKLLTQNSECHGYNSDRVKCKTLTLIFLAQIQNNASWWNNLQTSRFLLGWLAGWANQSVYYKKCSSSYCKHAILLKMAENLPHWMWHIHLFHDPKHIKSKYIIILKIHFQQLWLILSFSFLPILP